MTVPVSLPPIVFAKIFSEQECQQMILFAETQQWSVEQDTVDQKPAWELNVLKHPLGQAAAMRLRQRLLEERDDIALKNYQIYIRKYDAATRPSLSPHADRSVVSFTAALNDTYEGGDFVAINAENESVCIALSIGDAVVFDGTVLHAVTPVTAGTRYSIVMHCI